MRATLRDEFLITMQKFINHIDLTIRQIEGEVCLKMPDIELPIDLTDIEKDEIFINTLETSVYDWEASDSRRRGVTESSYAQRRRSTF